MNFPLASTTMTFIHNLKLRNRLFLQIFYIIYDNHHYGIILCLHSFKNKKKQEKMVEGGQTHESFFDDILSTSEKDTIFRKCIPLLEPWPKDV